MKSLALSGGKKAVTIDYEKAANRPLVASDSKEAVIRLLEKGEISQSSSVAAFEKKFAEFTGANYALACNNGTASLDCALFSAEVKPGDEVIVPSYTFWATVAPIVAEHAVPVFCDVDPETFCIDPKDIERKITSKTKAIMLVHVWGNPCDMDSIMTIAKKHGIRVIEDCSHAHGAKYRGISVGLHGDVGCFSLQASKLLPAGEGGVLVTNNRECYERAVALGQYDRIMKLPDDSPYRQYALTGMGHKYRPHPLGIAIANCELDRLRERNAIRNRNALEFQKAIADLDCFVAQKQYPDTEREFSYQYLYFDTKKFGGISTFTLLKALSAEGVICGYCGYGRLHNAPLFAQGGPYGDCGVHNAPVSLPVTEHLAESTFMAAPRFENDCPDLIAQYAEAYHKVASHVDELVAYGKEHNSSAEKKQLSGRSVAIFR